jgi:glycosyltransferase involved in cell wall biosynthesis
MNMVFHGVKILGIRRGWLSNILKKFAFVDWISVFHLSLFAIRINCMAYHAHELEALITAWICKVAKKCFQKPVKIVYDVHEWYPELSYYGVKELFRFKFLRMIDKLFSRSADLLIATEDEKAKRYEEYRKKRDVLILGHFPPLDLFSLFPTSKPPINSLKQKPFVVGYVGGLTLDRGILTILEVVYLAKKKNQKKINVLYVGDFSIQKHRDITLDYAKNKSIDLEITGWLPYEKIPGQIARMDVCMALLYPKPYYVNAIPIKLFEYMASGKPIIASDLKNIRSILGESRSGVVADPFNTHQLADILLNLIDDIEKQIIMGQSGRRYIEEGHNWLTLEKMLVENYNKIFSQKS